MIFRYYICNDSPQATSESRKMSDIYFETFDIEFCLFCLVKVSTTADEGANRHYLVFADTQVGVRGFFGFYSCHDCIFEIYYVSLKL